MKSPASELRDFVANGRPATGFAVAVLLGDLANQLLQYIAAALAGRNLYDKSTVFDRHIDGLALSSADFLRERAGNAQREAVSPFLELGSHGTFSSAIVYTLYILSGAAVKYVHRRRRHLRLCRITVVRARRARPE